MQEWSSFDETAHLITLQLDERGGMAEACAVALHQGRRLFVIDFAATLGAIALHQGGRLFVLDFAAALGAKAGPCSRYRQMAPPIVLQEGPV